jgi:cobalt-zinc-cadmium efflux system outer membrane protein
MTLDLPLDLPPIRRARIRAAAAAQTGAHYTFLADRAAFALDVDTLYVRAQVALARRDASAATARDAAQLLTLAEARRAAGDAADLDVELARINADQASSVAAGDSAEALDALLEWQAAMGVSSDSVRYAPTSEMEPATGGTDVPVPPVVTPRVAAAEAAVTAAQATVHLQRASRFGIPALQVGFDAHDPTEHGLLPLVGITLPLPVFNHNGGEIAAAHADLQRAQAELTLARLDAATQLTRAQHARVAALSRVTRDSAAVASANRVLTLSRTAYQEGEMTIADVLQAQRTYRDGVVQYQNDRLALFVNDAIVRMLTGHALDSL